MEKALTPDPSAFSRNPSIGTIFPDERHFSETVLRSIQLVELRILKIVDFICVKNDLTYWLDGGTLLGAVRHRGFIPWDDDIDIVMPRRDFERFIDIARNALPDDLELDTSADGGHERCFNIPCRIRDRHSRILDTDSVDNRDRGLFVDIIPSDIYHVKPALLSLEVAYRRLYCNATKIYDLFRKIHRRERGFPGLIFRTLPFVQTARSGLRLFNFFSDAFLSHNAFQRAGIGSPGYGYDVRWLRIFDSEDIYPLQRICFEDTKFFAPGNTDGVLKVFYGTDYMTPPERSKRLSKHLRTLILDTRVGNSPVTVEYLE